MLKIAPETQTLYAELLEQLSALELRRAIGHQKGCFVGKTIKDEEYVYFQHVEPDGGLRQIYVGRKTPLLKKLISRFEKEKALALPEAEHIKRLSAQIRAGGMMAEDPASARILKSLAEGGVFKSGAVLVGTHAFSVIGNMLGVNWQTQIKTHDIDIAGKRRIEIASPELKADVPTVLEKLEMGFLPVPALNNKHPSTSFKVRGQTLRVDLLTPARGKDDTEPVFLSGLNAAAQPLPFLDYLIEKTEKGAVINGGAVLVNVPNPARFAFHKLAVSQERGAAMHGKTLKDIAQAAALLGVLTAERPGDALLAWDALKNRKYWSAKAGAGLKLLARLYPAEHEAIKTLLK